MRGLDLIGASKSPLVGRGGGHGGGGHHSFTRGRGGGRGNWGGWGDGYDDDPDVTVIVTPVMVPGAPQRLNGLDVFAVGAR